jgi:hypothetical protein
MLGDDSRSRGVSANRYNKCGLTLLSLQVLMSDARHAQFSAPSSLPANELALTGRPVAWRVPR